MTSSRFASLTMDVEHDPPGGEGLRLATDQARREEFCAFIEARQISVTAFVTGRVIEEFPAWLQVMRGLGFHEFGLHSHSHDKRQPDSEEEIARGVAAFREFFGAEPEGYRAPYGLISQDGLRRLAGAGFRYDSSVFPTLRVDEYGYDNRHLPREPFWVETSPPILEVPLGVLSRPPLVLSLSYLKLVGWPAMRLLLAAARLPNPLVIGCHPYDFYVDDVRDAMRGWKRHAHSRNRHSAYGLLAKLIRYLEGRGYSFVTMRALVDTWAPSAERRASISRA